MTKESKSKTLNTSQIKQSVADFYRNVANDTEHVKVDSNQLGLEIGYTQEELDAVPEEANVGLGCGNPQQKAQPLPGEVVLDLGCGKGMDVFIASKKVTETGHVIGVDMTYEMIQKARHIADKRGFTNVEFRLGEIEHLPIADHTVDVTLSNCVINLSTDKRQVYREIFRVLKPGGRIGISDITLSEPLPQVVLDNPKMYGT